MTAALHEITEKMDADMRLGSLEVRLAKTPKDIDDAQDLRYQVFYEEMGAKPTPEMLQLKRDFDAHDEFCDHLLLIDHSRTEKNPVIGTYRLIRRAAAEKCGGFYSSSEYDVSRLVAYPGEIMELGRSCIHREFRTGPVMQLLWRGLSLYIARHNVALMFGCASLPGTDPQTLKIPLSYLYHHHLAPPALRAKALPERYVDMKMLPREAFDPNAAFEDLKLDPRSGSNSLPPLIKGYIRVGGFVGDGAVVDEQFNTTDICIIVKTDLMTRRYQRHYNLGGNSGIALPVE
jgi:putative hemolysin